MRFSARLDRALDPKTPPAPFHVVCTLEPVAGPVESERARLCAVLAIDTSRSMTGAPLEHVVQSVIALVELARPSDLLGLVAFSGGATVVLPITAMDEEGKRAAAQRVRRLSVSARTNVEAGLVTSAKLLEEASAASPGLRRGIILLSDGEPNVGACTPDALRALAHGLRTRTSVSVLGYGPHHHEDVLSAVAAGGGGAYHYVPDPLVCAPFFAQALGAQVDVVASAVEVTLSPRAGVEILRAVGRTDARVGSRGVVVPVADVVDGQPRQLVFEVIASPAELAGGAIATATARYRGARDGQPREIAVDVDADVREGGGLVAEPHAKVLFALADEKRRDARALADRGNFAAAAACLRPFMERVERAPGYERGRGELWDLAEQLLDEVMAYERRPDPEAYAVFRKSQTLVSAYEGSNVAGVPSSRFSQLFLDQTAGQLREAYVEIVAGEGVGQRFPLGARAVIGRAGTAEIALAARDVSRKHAEIFAAHGEYFVRDLGSTNPTLLNGEKLGVEPKKLDHGDVVKVGAVELAFQLARGKGAAPPLQ